MSERAQRIMECADRLGECTETPGEITRGYGTPALVQARGLVQRWMVDAGLTVRCDEVGNLVGRYEGDGPGTFVLGSHIDSVCNAGRYDGPLGVLVAIAAVERLYARGERLPFALEVVAFVDEEGLRYHASYLGSRVYAGIFDATELETVAADGRSLAEAVRAMGGDPERLGDARRDPSDLLGYVEVHIEQGPVLEAEDLPVGVVTSIAGQSRGTVTFAGLAGHAGTVPMELRHDALCAASEVVLEIERLAREWDGLVGTVGQHVAGPGAGNVIPDRVVMSFDVRHQDEARKAEACRLLAERAREVGARRGVEVVWETIQEHAAVPSSARLVELLCEASEAVTGTARRMSSGAGHDTVSMAHLTPEVAMLFVRCAGGVSHHPDECVTEADVAVAVEVVDGLLDRLAAADGRGAGAAAPVAAASGAEARP